MNKIIEFLKKHWKKLILAWFGICLVSGALAGAAEHFHWSIFGSGENKEIEEVTYNQFLEMVKDGKVDTVYYNTTNEFMEFTLFNEETSKMTKKEREDYKYGNEDKRTALYPAYDEFRKDMLELDVNMVLKTDYDGVLSIVLSFLPFFLLIVFELFLVIRMSKQDSFHAENSREAMASKVTFKDVIGLEEVVEDVQFIVDLLKNPEKGKEIGVKPPRGILFSGEPGCGKTLIAKAIAGEAGVPLFQASGSQFDEMFVGVGAGRIRSLFKNAKKNAPCVVFIDEIDAVGRARETAIKHGNDQTINELLTQMDGFNTSDGVFVIAATNKPDLLDTALTRPGRFDRQVVINPPKDWHERKKLFSYYLGKYRVDETLDVDSVAKQTPGFTGADVSAICNEAALIAIQKELNAINSDCIEEAIDKKVFKGNRSKKEQWEQDRRIVAYHEAGHAVASLLLGELITRVSIIGTTSGVGGAVFNADKETLFRTDKEFVNRIMIAYAGRVAEKIKFDFVTTGASNDITQATALLEQYVQKHGFDTDFGLLDVGLLQKQSVLDDSFIVNRLSELSKSLYSDTVELLTKEFSRVEHLASTLLERETLGSAEVQSIVFGEDQALSACQPCLVRV